MSASSNPRPPRVAAVIPVFNERKTIADIARRTVPHVDRVFVVDDGSTDGSLDVLDGLDVTAIRQPVNQGKGAALLRGMDAARRDGATFVVTLDADGQHPPECIPDLLRCAGPTRIVAGSRAADAAAIPAARRRANKTANFFISWAAGQWIEDTQCGFRLYPLALMDRVRLGTKRRSGFVFESEILIEGCRAGYRVVSAPIPALYDGVLQRPSHFRPFFDVSAIVVMVTLKILAKGFHIPGLFRSLRDRRRAQGDGPCNNASDAAL